MKISKNHHKKTPLKLIVLALAAIVLCGVGGYAYYLSAKSASDTDQTTQTDTKDPQDSTTTPDHTDPATPAKGEDEFEEEPTETVKDAGLTIKTLSQANGMVSARATAQNVDKGGRCIVYFSSEAGTPVSKYMTIANISDGVTCSIDVNELEFSYLGKWTARIVYTTPSDKKVEATGSLTIK